MEKLYGTIEDLVIYKSKDNIYKGVTASIPAKLTLGQDSSIETSIGTLPLKNVFNVECKRGKLLIECDNCFVIFLPN